MTAHEWTPTTAKELSRLVAENFTTHRARFAPVGGRTSLHSSGPLADKTILLSTNRLNQVVDYPFRDMTITVEAGIRIEALQAELAGHQQRLPIDIPQAGRASLGGAIASNTSGPGRFGYGTFRDYVIGISAVDGQGRLFSAGGRVVKNVAGYDLCKLLVGSTGRLATITEITLKLRPRFESRAIVIAAFDPERTVEPLLAELNRSRTRPILLDILNSKAAWQIRGDAEQPLPDRKTLVCIGFEGTRNETNWQAQTIADELQPLQPETIITIQDDSHQRLYDALVEFQTASDDPLTFRASVPKSRCDEFLKLASKHDVAAQAHAGNGIVNGHLPDRCTSAALAREIIQPLREFAERHSGSLLVVSCERDWISEIDWCGTRPASWQLMSRIKETLDPAGLMNPLIGSAASSTM